MADGRYLGDSVYVKPWEQMNGVQLYLDNGEGPHTIIYLEDAVMEALVKYITSVYGELL